MRILCYSFEPFSYLRTNVSSLVAQEVVSSLSAHTCSHLVLPVHFDSWSILKERISSFVPDMIIGFGVANNSLVRFERIALNYMRRDDGTVQRIIPGTVVARESSCSVFEQNILDNEPEESFFADLYVCNYTYFHCLGIQSNSFFVHIPVFLSDEKKSVLVKKIVALIKDL